MVQLCLLQLRRRLEHLFSLNFSWILLTLRSATIFCKMPNLSTAEARQGSTFTKMPTVAFTIDGPFDEILLTSRNKIIWFNILSRSIFGHRAYLSPITNIFLRLLLLLWESLTLIPIPVAISASSNWKSSFSK